MGEKFLRLKTKTQVNLHLELQFQQFQQFSTTNHESESAY